eukprot:scaffold79_cov259-Pinguiococcus_pyrenoidosus.AAC.16
MHASLVYLGDEVVVVAGDTAEALRDVHHGVHAMCQLEDVGPALVKHNWCPRAEDLKGRPAASNWEGILRERQRERSYIYTRVHSQRFSMVLNERLLRLTQYHVG